jgi:Zn-dependent M28 family amino/carboxypeptidase
MRGLSSAGEWVIQVSIYWTNRHRLMFTNDHSHDMMSKRLYKMYIDITNVIVRVSDGTDQGKEHALLVNAHHDSQLTSPDDALAVGVMLDCMRVLVDDETWSPTNAVIFRESTRCLMSLSSDLVSPVFNNAEESLCDASHLFATQHPLAQTYVGPSNGDMPI